MKPVLFLYHATYLRHLPSIFSRGLGGEVVHRNWTDSVAGVVCLAATAEVAESYAETAELADESDIDSVVLLRIDCRFLDDDKMSSDRNVLDGGDTFEYNGVIPSVALKCVTDSDDGCTDSVKLVSHFA